MTHVGVVRVRDGVLGLGVLRGPLFCASGALGELPLVLEEDLEVLVVPLGGLGGPCALGAAGGHVDTGVALEVLPAETLVLDTGALGLGSEELRVGGTMGLAEGVTAGHECHGLFVVHRHPSEGLTDITGGQDRVRVAVGALGVHVDEAHLDRTERVLEVAVSGVALIAEPLVLRAPVDVLLGLPDVDATAAEAEGLETHRLECDVAGEDHEVCPRQFAAVLLLDRPQQAAGLVQVGVVGPGVQRGESLAATAAATATVLDAIGAGRVPGHADEQRTVVTVVSRPPVL